MFAKWKTLEREDRISSSSFGGQLADYYSHVFSLTTLCHWMSSPFQEIKRGINPRFHLFVFVYVVTQEN